MDEHNEIARNIFYKLTEGANTKDLAMHRTAKLTALLCQHLAEKKIVTTATLDELLTVALQ